MSVGHILVVCTGNICRSPLIERLLQRELDRRWGQGQITVSSAGTLGLDARPMDARAAAVLTALGGDPAGHRARRLEEPMVARADLVLAAAREHRAAVTVLHPKALRYSFTYIDFANLAAHLPDDLLPQGNDAGEHLRQVVRLLAGRRGLTLPVSGAQADIVDPYCRDDAVYAQMRQQVEAVTPAAVRVLTGETG